ncbi:MAG: hypothetical protein PHO75_04485, partial [Candidatus Shapirobacteria bacterium]|nr:hypothetical protein [Candidatus Shapirobacteria bacterium]
IISKNGKNAIKLDKSNFRLEDNLQQYIYDNPESIPLYDIKEDIKLLILAREFSTKSGPIDALGVDKDGELYLIETKFYKNPDKRTVVAQVLDYGASLWSNFRDFGNFIEQINLHTNKDFGKTLKQRLTDFFEISDDEINYLLENTRRNLNDGNFKFVVLMDHLHDQLKDLIIFLNNNSEFTVYAVELEYYKHQDFEILIPKLYGSEVKKDIGKSTVSKIILTDEEFINYYKDRPEETLVEELLRLSNRINENQSNYPNIMSIKTPKFLNFYLTTSFEDKVSINLPVNPDAEGGGLQIWGSDVNRQKVESVLNDSKLKYEKIIFKGNKSGKIARIQLKNITIDQFDNFLKRLAII